MNILQFLKQEHAHVNQLFEKLVDTSDGAKKTRQNLFERLRTELHIHNQIEVKHLYPLFQKHQETKDLVKHALEETKESEAMLRAIGKLAPDDEQFMTKVTELQQAIRDHVREEEDQLVPKGAEFVPEDRQQELVRKMQEEKRHEMQAAK
jgi:hemerythrin superfamily protein